MSSRAADDFNEIRKRLEEIRRERVPVEKKKPEIGEGAPTPTSSGNVIPTDQGDYYCLRAIIDALPRTPINYVPRIGSWGGVDHFPGGYMPRRRG